MTYVWKLSIERLALQVQRTETQILYVVLHYCKHLIEPMCDNDNATETCAVNRKGQRCFNRETETKDEHAERNRKFERDNDAHPHIYGQAQNQQRITRDTHIDTRQ